MGKNLAKRGNTMSASVTSDVQYNVVCGSCGNFFQPGARRPLWWKAKKHADKGYLDAVCISGYECGCEKRPENPDAPFRVFGIDWDMQKYDIPCKTFVEAIRTFRELQRCGDTFIKGVSPAVEEKLNWG